MKYTGQYTREISFPLGGIGSGCIGLAGNGQLIDWEIFNRSDKGSINGMTHFAVRAEKDGKIIDTRILQGDQQPPYTGTFAVKKQFTGFGFGPSHDTMCGFPHFREHEFTGEFPLATIDFQDDHFPGLAQLQAWSPLIPGNSYDSSLPAAFFAVHISNTTSEPLDYSVVCSLEHPDDSVKATIEHQTISNDNQLFFRSGKQTNDFDYFDLTLGTDAEQTSYQEYWYRGSWRDKADVYWKDLNTPGYFQNRHLEESDNWNDTGLLAAHITLQPGETKNVRFILTWNVPNRCNDFSDNVEADSVRFGVPNRWKNWYATQWSDSAASNSYAFKHHHRLKADTECYCKAFFGASLPEEVKDGASACLGVLKSPTCLRLEDGTFYGWEGVGIDWGSCEGTCTHVWNYAQAMAFLFPDLERSIRDANYKYNVDEFGGSHFRMRLPLGIKNDDPASIHCVDGQFGDIMKTYRDWKICGDTQWLGKLWPTLKRTLCYAWSDKNPDRWDLQKTGVIHGRQHHTLDVELFGPNAWLTGHYLGALKAAAEMAEALGELEFVDELDTLFTRGKKWVDENLFNGQYYVQKIDIHDRSKLMGYQHHAQDKPEEFYWSQEHNEMKYQIGEGVLEDMPLAQWYANLYGLGEIFNPDKCRKNLQSIYQHNFLESSREHVNTWRIYSLNDEAGVQICAWPQGCFKPVIPIPYYSETMHGFEWAFACHMLQNGMVEQSMQVVRSIRQRYDGFKRNPWNEIECGSNYARSMAAYGLVNAYVGLKFDMVKKYIGFAPVITGNGRYFWSIGSAWGEYEIKENQAVLNVLGGCLELNLWEAGTNGNVVKHNARVLKVRKDSGIFHFDSLIKLNKNDVLTCE